MLHKLESIFLKVVFVEIANEILALQVVESGTDSLVEEADGRGDALAPLPSGTSSSSSSTPSASATTTTAPSSTKGGVSRR